MSLDNAFAYMNTEKKTLHTYGMNQVKRGRKLDLALIASKAIALICA
jgi:hypothetical protein